MNRVPFVMLSGGLDSEVVVKSFIAANVPFRAITFRFLHGLNRHETHFVERFLKRHKIDHQYFDIDINRWAPSNEAHDLFSGSQAGALNLIPHMKLMNHIWFELDGMPVLGNGDMYLENGENGWNYIELEYMLAWFRHAVRFSILGGIGFFQHTPEITLSMLREPKFERLGKNLDVYANRVYETSKFVKYNVYRQYWPDLELRPKFGGQEMVVPLFESLRDKWIQERTDPFDDKFSLSYDELRAQLERT